MIFPIFTGLLLIVLSVVVQAYGAVVWIKRVSRAFRTEEVAGQRHFILKVLSFSFMFFSMLHAFQTLLWALPYWWLPTLADTFTSFSEAWYFSLVTFTSLGYGDITLSGDWRLLSGIEAVNGIMLIGWSTAMMYSLIQGIFKSLSQKGT